MREQRMGEKTMGKDLKDAKEESYAEVLVDTIANLLSRRACDLSDGGDSRCNRSIARNYRVDNRGTLSLSGGATIKKSFDEVFNIKVLGDKEVNILPFLLLNRTLIGGAVNMSVDTVTNIVEYIKKFRGGKYGGIISEIKDLATGITEGTAIASVIGESNVRLLDTLPVLRNANWVGNRLSMNPAKTWMTCYDKRTTVEECVGAAVDVSKMFNKFSFVNGPLTVYSDDLVICSKALAVLWAGKVLHCCDDSTMSSAMELLKKSFTKDSKLEKYLTGEMSIDEYIEFRVSNVSENERQCDYEARIINEIVSRIRNKVSIDEIPEEIMKSDKTGDCLCHSTSYIYASLSVLISYSGYTGNYVEKCEKTEELLSNCKKMLSDRDAELKRVTKELSEKSNKVKELEKRAKRNDKEDNNDKRIRELEKKLEQAQAREEKLKNELDKITEESNDKIKQLRLELDCKNRDVKRLEFDLISEKDRYAEFKGEIDSIREMCEIRDEMGALDMGEVMVSVIESDRLIKVMTKANKELKKSLCNVPNEVYGAINDCSIKDVVSNLQGKKIGLVSSSCDLYGIMGAKGISIVNLCDDSEGDTVKDCDIVVIPTRLLDSSSIKYLSDNFEGIKNYVFTDEIGVDNIIRDVYIDAMQRG